MAKPYTSDHQQYYSIPLHHNQMLTNSTHHHVNLRGGLREIQSKRDALISLETALKKRVNELKELCLKEGELTGHLPIDYPLQPREPIPQIRRRTNQNNNNVSEAISVAPPYSSKLYSNFRFQNPIDVTNVTPLQNFNTDGNFQLNIEETKPFQMSDFYKYSSKHRQKINESQKSTRQLQEEVLRKNPLKFAACDDQIQASVKLIEKSGQKFLEATAKAIAGNPGLAEKIHNILPNSNEHFQMK